MHGSPRSFAKPHEKFAYFEFVSVPMRNSRAGKPISPDATRIASAAKNVRHFWSQYPLFGVVRHAISGRGMSVTEFPHETTPSERARSEQVHAKRHSAVFLLTIAAFRTQLKVASLQTGYMIDALHHVRCKLECAITLIQRRSSLHTSRAMVGSDGDGKRT
jgi:hypothetical protein